VLLVTPSQHRWIQVSSLEFGIQQSNQGTVERHVLRCAPRDTKLAQKVPSLLALRQDSPILSQGFGQFRPAGPQMSRYQNRATITEVSHLPAIAAGFGKFQSVISEPSSASAASRGVQPPATATGGRDSPQRLQQHSHLSLQAVDFINNLCTQPLVLRDWHFPEELCHLTIRLLGAFTGFGGAQTCAPEPDNLAQVVAAPALPHDEALFLNSIFFLMLSRDLTPLALAQSLARARFGHWSDDRRTFFTLDYHVGQGLLIRWAIRTKEAQDLGVSVGDFQGLSNNLVQICTGMAKGALQTRTALHGRAIHNRFRPNGAMARRRRQGPTRKNLQDGAGQRRFATR
jgi:hypothetical protein